MLPNFSGTHVQRSGISGGELALHQACSPAFGYRVEHAVNGFGPASGRKPNLVLAIVGDDTNQMNSLHLPISTGNSFGCKAGDMATPAEGD